ncbi:MAG: proton-conducting transporter membrane subunit [Gammaproteobacteria bacterium]|jgi:formate hydrogenlyase subunit 3/multisubunit Na+/H+ antiporter MnhD subunit
MNKMILLIALPLLAAFLIPVVARFSTTVSRLLGPAVLAFVLVFVALQWSVVGRDSFAIFIGGFLPPVGIVFYVDHFSLMFSAIIAAMLLVVWPWGQYTPVRQQSLYMLLAASSFGLVLSSDLFNLYVFYELLAVATYGLVANQSHKAAPAAALRYLFVSCAGSVMLLIGIAIIYTITGTLNIAHLATMIGKLHGLAGLSAFILIAVGAGVKAEMFPVNSWVPEVYGTSSKSLSALLAGLISKLAVVLILRVSLMLFQVDVALDLLLIVGILGVLSGEMVAWRAKDVTRMLSFSSIAQLGLIFVALSLSGTIGLWLAVGLMLHHLLVKGGLFLLADSMHGSFSTLKGLARKSPILGAVFLIFIFSLLGIPPFPGFWIKLMLVINLAQQGDVLYQLAIGVVLFATVIEASYLFKLVRIIYQKGDENIIEPHQTSTSGMNLLYAKFFALIVVVSMPFVSPISDRLKDMSRQSVNVENYIETIMDQPKSGGQS